MCQLSWIRWKQPVQLREGSTPALNPDPHGRLRSDADGVPDASAPVDSGNPSAHPGPGRQEHPGTKHHPQSADAREDLPCAHEPRSYEPLHYAHHLADGRPDAFAEHRAYPLAHRCGHDKTPSTDDSRPRANRHSHANSFTLSLLGSRTA